MRPNLGSRRKPTSWLRRLRRCTPLRQEVLLLVFVLLISIDIRIVNNIGLVNGYSSWSKTPSCWTKGGDCQRIMPRNNALPFQQLMLKHQFKASGLKTCSTASWGQNLGSISKLIVREGGSENEFSVRLLSSHDTYNPHPT